MEIDWDCLTEDAWDARLAGGSPLQQSWRYGAVVGALGARVGRAVIRDGGREVALAQVIARRGLRLVMRGPVWLDDAEPDRRRAVLRRLARVPGVVIATPETAVAGMGVVPLITPRHHAIWDLSPDPVTLRAGMVPKWRARLGAAERAGLHLSQAPAALEALILAEGAQRADRRYRALPPDFARAWAGIKGASRVLSWAQGGEIQAAVQVLVHGTWASYHLAWASEAGRAARAHWAMLWAMAQWLRGRGVTRFDLGDVDAEAAPGLARFKLGTGAALVRLGPTCLVLPG